MADVLHEVASLFCFPSALLQSAAELRLQHAEIARLTAENETLKLQLLKATHAKCWLDWAWAEYCLVHRTVDAPPASGTLNPVTASKTVIQE